MHGGYSGVIMDAHYTGGGRHGIMAREVLAFMIWGGLDAWRRWCWELNEEECYNGARDQVLGEEEIKPGYSGEVGKSEVCCEDARSLEDS